MTSSHRTSARNPERGSIVVIVAFMGTALLGFTALAVDLGYLYQSQRGLQATVDAAVMAGLHKLATDTSSTGQTNASNLATAFATDNGYTTGGGTTVTPTVTSSTVALTITAPQPLFFAGVFGLHSKSLTATAKGQLSPAEPAVLALGNNCAGTGIQFNGNGLTITGNVEGNGVVNYYGAADTTDGAVSYNGSCASPYSAPATAPTGGAAAGGGSIASPYTYTASSASFPTCDFGCFTCGTLSLGGTGSWWASGGPSGGTLANGVYCANGNIDLSGATIYGGSVTLVATGQITISSSSAVLSPYVDGLIAFSSQGGTATNCGTPAINIGNAGVTLNGSFYAPNGCINASGNNITINGSLIGADVQVGIGGASSINSAAGGAQTAYLLQ